jgi:hypothetical protein
MFRSSKARELLGGGRGDSLSGVGAVALGA